MEQVLSFKRKILLEGVCHPEKQTECHRNCFPSNTWENMKVPIHLLNFATLS